MLYICPTPIGNLKDITLRTLEVLQSVAEIGCEDTRVSAKLLAHYNIKKPLFSYREHNEQTMSERIIDKLSAGLDIAIISDAGMPGISDPGEVVIKACIEADLAYTVLPGANAALVGLVASNIATQPFYYHGFLDRKQIHQQLESVKHITATLIFYESPHRLLKTLLAIDDVLGNRVISVTRELTKRYESYLHTTVKQAFRHFSENPPKGEFVLIVKGFTEIKKVLTLDQVITLAMQKIDAGEQHKQVVKELAKIYQVDRQALYKATIK